jgi:large subunit ribosomal protein L15
MKKRRGAGSRGGRGKAGTGKRGDAKKPSVWKKVNGREYLGKFGFSSIKDPKEVLNVSDLQDQLPRLVEEGVASESKGTYTIDMADAKVDKLLGSGSINVAVNVTVQAASDSAVKKVEAAGGSVTLPSEE